jgi:serine/threonine protein kinase
MAPELFYYVEELNTETSEYTNAVDLWSLGCIVYRVVTGAVPFPSLLSLKNYCRDPSKAPFNMPPTMEEAGKFVQKLLMPHPAKRPLASTALESTWLTRSKRLS